MRSNYPSGDDYYRALLEIIKQLSPGVIGFFALLTATSIGLALAATTLLALVTLLLSLLYLITLANLNRLDRLDRAEAKLEAQVTEAEAEAERLLQAIERLRIQAPVPDDEEETGTLRN